MRVSQQTRRHRDRRRSVQLIDLAPGPEELLEDAIVGLTGFTKTLPGKHLYDELGSWLYEQVCGAPEYYPARAELAVTREHAAEIAAVCGHGVTLVELGSGTSLKTRELLPHLQAPAAYVPVDISRAPLLTAAEGLAFEFPRLPVFPICADFTRRLPPIEFGRQRTIVYMAGGTLGGLRDAEAVDLLRRSSRMVGPDGGVLIGVEAAVDPAVAVRAREDPRGLHAAFNLNVLTRLGRELGADFDVSGFRHRAVYAAAHGRVEMQLVSLRDQIVHLGPYSIDVAEDEAICTGVAHCYEPLRLAAIVAAAGLRVHQTWQNAAAGPVCVHYLKPCGERLMA